LTAFGIERVDICPWAMREGVVLRRLDWLNEEDQLRNGLSPDVG